MLQSFLVDGKSWMDRYLVESPHNHDNCTMVIKEVHAMGYLHHFEWGCEDDVHCGWAILEAGSHDEAKMVVPSLVRGEAKAVRLVRYGELAARETAENAER